MFNKNDLSKFLGRVNLVQFFGGRAEMYLRTPAVENVLLLSSLKLCFFTSEITVLPKSSLHDRVTEFDMVYNILTEI